MPSDSILWNGMDLLCVGVMLTQVGVHASGRSTALLTIYRIVSSSRSFCR